MSATATPNLSPHIERLRDARVEDALVRSARALSSHLDLSGVCAAALDAVEDVFEARSSWILLRNARGTELMTVDARGRGSEAFRNLSIRTDAGVLGLACKTRQVVFVPSARDDTRWFDVARVHAAPLRSVFAVPLLYNDDVLGVVGLDSPAFSSERPPTAFDVARLEALAAQTAIAITNARLFNESEQDRDRLRALVREQHRLRTRVFHLEDHVKAAGAFTDIVGTSAALATSMKQADLAAPGDTTILLLGETGCGKEVMARFIHERSGRADGPFVPVNCAALPEALVESELFGHEKGAFTGALARKPGKFEIAHRGTIFLDEIGDLPRAAQAKLLRVLQDRVVQRVGSTCACEVDVRVVAATNQDLERAMGQGLFRRDLYYRLSVFPIRIPPLRERREDIPDLVRHFASRFAAKRRNHIDRVSPAALATLCAYDWPGNIRELQNVMERALILTRGTVVEADAIAIPSETRPATGVPGAEVVPLAEAERRAILAALEAARWRISGASGAARLLGLKPTTLNAKMKRLGIRRPVLSS